MLAELDLPGRVYVVTGCESGIGFETMRALAWQRIRTALEPAAAAVGVSTLRLPSGPGHDAGARTEFRSKQVLKQGNPPATRLEGRRSE